MVKVSDWERKTGQNIIILKRGRSAFGHLILVCVSSASFLILISQMCSFLRCRQIKKCPEQLIDLRRLCFLQKYLLFLLIVTIVPKDNNRKASILGRTYYTNSFCAEIYFILLTFENYFSLKFFQQKESRSNVLKDFRFFLSYLLYDI
jgi:hypothetical protein